MLCVLFLHEQLHSLTCCDRRFVGRLELNYHVLERQLLDPPSVHLLVVVPLRGADKEVVE